MAKLRVVYAQRASTAQSYDTALINDLRARFWLVTVFANWSVPIVPAYWADVALLIIGAPGTDNKLFQYGLEGLPVPILSLCRYTAANQLAMGTAYGAYTLTALARKAGVADPRAAFASVSVTSASSQIITPPASGVAHDYYRSGNSNQAGVARKIRTLDGVDYEDVFWGYHRIDLLSGDALDLWRNYSGGAAPANETLAALASPLAPMEVLELRRALVALGSPLEDVAALGAPAADTRVLLGSPLQGRVSALAVPTPAALGRWPSPLGAPPRALVAPLGAARAALGSPLGLVRARAWEPREALQALAIAPRPRLLSDPLPLRRGAELPGYRADAVLPWVYGRVRLSPLPLDDAGLEWLLADHPILAVAQVRDDGLPVDGWELVQGLDATAHPVAKLRLARAPKGALSADLAGRVDARNGELLEHPADICADLVARCGLPPGDWSALRARWPGVRLGGVIASLEPLREVLARVVGSLGARWSAAPLRAWAPHEAAPLATLAALDIDEGSASATTTSLATRLILTWGWDWASAEPRGSVVLEAPAAVAAFGAITLELSAPWLRSARDALALGHAELGRRARPTWEIELKLGAGARWRPGDRVTLAHPWLPAGAAEISRISQDGGARLLTCERPAGGLPRVEVVRHGALLEARSPEPVAVSYRDGIATFTVLGEDGNPLAGAAVTLDEAATRYTDRLGQVQFATERGLHALLITLSGYAPLEIEVEV